MESVFFIAGIAVGAVIAVVFMAVFGFFGPHPPPTGGTGTAAARPGTRIVRGVS